MLLIAFDFTISEGHKIKVCRCFNVLLNVPGFSLIINVCSLFRLEIGIMERVYYLHFPKHTIL